MAYFPAQPKLEPYPDGRTWFLLAPFLYLRGAETITVPAGFESDFASTPRALWSIFPPYSTYGRASLIHDWLYWEQRKSRAQADAILLEAMTCVGVAQWQRTVLYYAVRAFGWYAWHDNSKLVAAGYSRMHSDGFEPIWGSDHI